MTKRLASAGESSRALRRRIVIPLLVALLLPVAAATQTFEPASVPAVKGDFDGDGKADVLFRHLGSRENLVWFMNGITRTGEALMEHVPVRDNNWQIVGTADFDADQKTDILWRHPSSGQIVVWYMDGITRTGAAYTNPSRLADTYWRIAATGDFSSDGLTDILWRDTATGQNMVWLMNGVGMTSSPFTNPDQLADTNWAISGAADFNSDLKPDILWHHAVSGKIVVWFMNGVTRTSGVFTTPSALTDTSWRIGAVADYGSGQADLLWRNVVSGKMMVWYMSGVSRIGSAFTNPDQLSDTRWVIVGPK